MRRGLVDELTMDQPYRLPQPKPAQEGLQLFQKGRYSGLRVNATGDVLTGFCQGSESEPYPVLVQLAREGGKWTAVWRCECRSNKKPCRHAAGLMIAWAQAPDQF